MKFTIIILIILFSTITAAQDFSFSIGAALKSYQFKEPRTFDILKQTDGLSKSLYGFKATIDGSIDLPFINKVELSFLIFPKTLWKTTYPETSVEFPDGTGRYYDIINEFYDYELNFSPKYYFPIFENGQLGIGPFVGYGLYKKSEVVGLYSAHSSFPEFIYGFDGIIKYSLSKHIAVRSDISYVHFKPSDIVSPQPNDYERNGEHFRSGTSGLNTFVSDLGGLSITLGLEFDF